MSPRKHTSRGGGDRLEVDAENRPFDTSTTAWLIGQGVHYLNTAGKEGELAYLRVIELLRRNSDDVLKTVMELFRQANSGDAPLRWSLLYILSDAGDVSSADFLVSAAAKELPEPKEDEGCESSRDAEMLVCTMAVHALQRIARRYPEVSEHILKIVSARPYQPILIEAVKVADELGLKEMVREVLPQEDQWILEIRRARTEELFAEPQREDGKERGFTPPNAGRQYTAPQVTKFTRTEE